MLVSLSLFRVGSTASGLRVVGLFGTMLDELLVGCVELLIDGLPRRHVEGDGDYLMQSVQRLQQRFPHATNVLAVMLGQWWVGGTCLCLPNALVLAVRTSYL